MDHIYFPPYDMFVLKLLSIMKPDLRVMTYPIYTGLTSKGNFLKPRINHKRTAPFCLFHPNLLRNDNEHPTAAMAVLGDFCFLAGEPDKELAACMPAYCQKDFIIMVPQNDAWRNAKKPCPKGRAPGLTTP